MAGCQKSYIESGIRMSKRLYTFYRLLEKSLYCFF